MAKKKKKTRKRVSRKKSKVKDGLQIVSPESGTPIDFEKIMRDGKCTSISGSAKDLIRDAYDAPYSWLHNGYADPADRKAAFLMGRGWSATIERRQMIADAGIPVMAINDFPEDGPKPKYWCSGDPPIYFGERLWTDPDIIKFCAMTTVDRLRPRTDAYAPALKTTDAPNVHYFHAAQNSTDVESWLHTPWLNWGTSICADNVPELYYASARSSMLIGMRLLWHLGYREVFLLGCDCTPHHHKFPKYYETIFHHLEQIKPAFDRYGYKVYQCNPDSHLRVFEMADFVEAVEFGRKRSF